MELEIIKKEIEDIKKKYLDSVESVYNLLKKYDNLIVRIPRGEYKNRWGKITSITVNHTGDVLVLIRPIRLIGKRKGNELLNERPDARTYWKLSEVTEIK